MSSEWDVVPQNEWDVVPHDPSFLEQLKVALKQNMVQPENLANRAASGIAGGIADLLGKTEARDKIFQAMEGDIEKNRQWANPNNIEPGIVANTLGVLPSLPAQMATMGFAPAETAQEMVKRGEPLGRSLAGAGVTAAANIAGQLPVLGPVGQKLATKIATGALSNVGQTAVQKALLSKLSTTEEGKKANEITLKDLVQAGILGAGMGGIAHLQEPIKPSTPKSAPKDIIAALRKTTETTPIPEQSMNVEGDMWRKQAQQTELPFSTGVENIAARQRDMFNPNQTDMFLDNPGGERSPYPAAEKLQAEQAQLAEQLRRVQAQHDAQTTVEGRQHLLEQEMALRVSYEQNLREQARLRGMNDTGFSKWEANKNVDDANQSAAQLKQLNEKGQQMAITEDYGNHNPFDVMPNMRVDENGIPIRADLSMEAQNLENPLQRNLWGDELPVKTGDGGVPLTQALDSMPPGAARTEAITQLTGLRRGQGGGIHPDLLTLGIPALVRKIHDMFSKEESTKIPTGYTGVDYAKSMGVDDTMLQTGPSADEAIAATHTAIAKAEALGKDTDSNLFKSVQAGLVLAGEKIKATAPWVQAAGRWMAYQQHYTDYMHRKYIQPLEKTYSSLGKEGLETFAAVMKEGQLTNTKYTTEQLTAAGVPDNVIKAIVHYRQEDARALNTVNETRRALGKPEITADEAHFHSHFQGDFHIFVKDKNGNMLWPVHTRTKAEARAAEAWLKDYFKDNPDVDTNQIYTQFKPGDKFSGSKSTNMLATLQDLEHMFPEGSKNAELVQEAMRAFLDEQGNKAFGQNLMQEKMKANYRGFEGDKPWKTPKQNAREYVKASTQNLLDQHEWAATQQMMAEVKKMLSDPVIQEKQPNNVALVKNYLLYNTGVSSNIFKTAQRELANTWVGDKLHLSSTSVPGAVRDLKAIGYAVTLGASVPYAIATPLQAIAGTAGNIVRSVNLGEINPKHAPEALGSVLQGIYSGLTGAKPFTSWSRDALQYAKDNGIATNVLFDEYQNIGGNKALEKLKETVNFTISRPDQVCRLPVFMAFANMLEKSGKFPNKEAAFQRAGEITENIMISMKAQDRPLAIDRMGPVGDALYMFKAPLVNMYNTLALGGHDVYNAVGTTAKAKALAAPLTYLTMAALVGGVHNLPGMEEIESGLHGLRGLLAQHFPSLYADARTNPVANAVLSPKEAALRAWPSSSAYGDVLNYGAASVATGLGITSRFGGGIMDVEHPLNAVSPLLQEGKEWAKAAGSLLHPNASTISSAVREQVPNGLRGVYEHLNPMYTAAQDPQSGNRLMIDPNSLGEGAPKGDVWRTPEQQKLALWGLKSFDEAKARTGRALANNTAFNDNVAAKAAAGKLGDALYRKNIDDATAYAKTIIKLTGNGELVSQAINDALLSSHISKEQAMKLQAKTLPMLKAVQELQQMK